MGLESQKIMTIVDNSVREAQSKRAQFDLVAWEDLVIED
jgi:hypothetical protein